MLNHLSESGIATLAALKQDGAQRGSAAAICLRAMSLIGVFLVTGCATETLFRSNFDSTPVGQVPATTQAVGTAHLDGPPGSVTVIAPPVLPSGRWVQISRPTGPQVA